MDNNRIRFTAAAARQVGPSLRRQFCGLRTAMTTVMSLVCLCSVSFPAATGQDATGQKTDESVAEPVVQKQAAGEDHSAPPEDVADHEVAWLHDRASAQETAIRRKAPVLLIAGAQWCGPCRLLDLELKKANVQKELERWVPVHLDVDTHPEDATQLAVAGIPAFRVITPSGRVVGSREGFADASEIASWLQDQYQQAMQDSQATDWVPGKLSARQVVRILKAFRSREATVREAATTRLTSAPEIASAPVVASFIDSSLAERLACLDLLNAWDAPIEGLDPWIPSTITDARLKLLQDWVEKRDFDSTDDPGTLNAVQTIEVRRLIRRLKTETGSSAFAIREQLARIGLATLPMIRTEIDNDPRSEVQDALNLARYRITASDRYLINFPGELEKLVDKNFDERIAAVDRLIKMAAETEEALLLELFSDPVPLVRELALKGLTKIRGSLAGGALVQLLDDEDPNVRAAVLQQLAEQPALILVPRVAEYIETEDDPDLVVHAVRFFRAVETIGAAKAMSELLDHPSWRVRAEAADGLGSLMGGYELQALKSKADIADRLLPLLADEDTFVAQKSVQALVEMEVPGLDLKLRNAIDERPEIAATIITSIGSQWSTVDTAIQKLRTLIEHPRPDIRAAAATMLTTYGDTQDETQDGILITKALRDTDRSVRLATSQRLLQRIGSEFEARLSPEPEAYDYSKMGFTEYESTTTTDSGGLLSGIMSLFSGANDAVEVAETNVEAEPVPAVEEADTELTPQEERTAEDWQSRLQAFVESRAIDETILQTQQSLLESHFYAPPFEELQTLFSSDDKDEKLFAAMCLAVLGEEDAWEYILEQAVERKHLTTLSSLLVMIPWERKLILYQRLLQTAKSESEYSTIASFLAGSFEQRSSDLLWELLNEDFVNDRLLGELVQPLWQSHFSDQHYGTYDLPENEMAFMKQRAASVIDEGTPNQRVLALALLALEDPAPAVEAAAKILADESAPASLRADALQVSLCTLPEAEAQELAVQTLQKDDPEQIKPALLWLSMGSSTVSSLRGSIYLEAASNNESWTTSNEPKFLRPTAPPGLTLQHVEPFLKSEDKTVALCAAYQAVLQGETQYLPQILLVYEKNPDNEQVIKMAYQAIAITNHAPSIPVLNRIYQTLAQSEVPQQISEFYWTIRIMTGPEVIKFRGLIRSEQGKRSLSWQRQSEREISDYGGF